MRQLRAVLFVALPLAACGGSGSGNPDATIIVPDAAPDAFVVIPDAPPDAPNYDFSCETTPEPTTATATVTLSGTAQGVTVSGMTPSIDPLAAATIDFCKGDCTNTNLLDAKTSATDGTFTSAALSTGGTPLDGYVKTSKTGFRTTNVFPASPVIADVANIPALVFSTGAFSALVTFLGGGAQQDVAKGNLGVVVTDCALTPISGATITVKQGGIDVAGTTLIDLSALAAQAAGTVVVLNVPAGATEIGATYMGHTLRAHTVLSVAGQTTATQIKPGF